jgi:carbonic anhydrase
VLKTPLIMVLGHEACGAVDATIKSVKDGTTLPGHLPSLVAALKPAVDAVQGQGGDTLGNAIRRNVMLNVDKLKSAAPILSAFAGDNKIRVVGGIYEGPAKCNCSVKWRMHPNPLKARTALERRAPLH